MAQVQNGRLYIRYRSSSHKKTKQRSEKKLTDYITSLFYIAKSTLKTPLTFSKVEKTQHENFDFVHLLSSFLLLLLLLSSSSFLFFHQA